MKVGTMTQARLSRWGCLWLFFLLGAYAQIAQAVLIRELFFLFQGSEIALGGFYGSWLGWVAAGGWLAYRLSGRDPLSADLRFLAALSWLLPLLLVLQIVLIRLARGLMALPVGQFVPVGELMGVALLVTLPGGVALGMALPLAARRLVLDRGVRRGDPSRANLPREVTALYVMEAFGALVGAALFTLVMVEWLGIWHSLGGLALLLGGAWHLPGVWRREEAPKREGGPWWRSATGGGRSLREGFHHRTGLLAAGAGLIVLVTSLGDWIESRAEEWRFAALHPGLTLLDSIESRYGHQAVARLGEQYSVVADGRIGASFPDPENVALEAGFFAAQAIAPQRVLLFGGVAGGLAAALLRQPLARLEVIEEDRLAFDHLLPFLEPSSREALADPRLRLVFGDGRAFVNDAGREAEARNGGYDLILVLSAEPQSARLNRYFTREFYLGAKRLMPPRGVLCTRIGGASNYLGREVESLGGSVYHTLGSVFAEVLVIPGERQLFCAAMGAGILTADPEELRRRLRAVNVEFAEELFARLDSLMQPERIAPLRQALARGEFRLNSDDRPVTFLRTLAVWSHYTTSGFGELLRWVERLGYGPGLWALGVAAALLAILGPGGGRRGRKRALLLLTLGCFGFAAMALQLMVIFGYQARVGLLFGHIALLNGLFMSGLAAGAWMGSRGGGPGRHPGALLGIVLALVGVIALRFPELLSLAGGEGSRLRGGFFFVLAAVVGWVVGVGFPLVVRLLHDERREQERNGSEPTEGAAAQATGGAVMAADHLGGALGGILTGGLLVPLFGVAGTGELLSWAVLVTGLALLPFLLPTSWFGWVREWGKEPPTFPWRGTILLLWWVALTALGVGWFERRTEPGPQVTFSAELLHTLTGVERWLPQEDPHPLYVGETTTGEKAGVALASAPVATVEGYGGPMNLLVAADTGGRILGLRLLASHETPAYIRELPAWLQGLVGRDLGRGPLSLKRIDALTGATVTSRAVIASINQAVTVGLDAGLGIRLPPAPSGEGGEEPGGAGNLRLATVVVMLLLFIPVWWRGRDRERLGYLLLSFVGLGLLTNGHLTEVELGNALLGRGLTWEANPGGWLLATAALVLTLTLGQVYCGFICPFGALQEGISRLGRRLGWRRGVGFVWGRRGRFVKYLLLASGLALAGLEGDGHWLAFNPMQVLFSSGGDRWLWGLGALVLSGSLLWYRFWCRHLCPLGALLALGNRVTLLERFAPKRRIFRCDLEVGHEKDLDCIRCHRCISGADLLPAPTIGGGLDGPGPGEWGEWGEIAARPGETGDPMRGHPKGVSPGEGLPRGRGLGGDRLFVGLLLVSLALIGVILHQGGEAPAGTAVGGWRRIDQADLRRQLESGRLADAEARWYHREESLESAAGGYGPRR
ncbi:MAG: 4Fe-4S binding protein [Magnetococcales bacterium]|nr:4Fe-4S binding protein [Magnetococcales bacterium]